MSTRWLVTVAVLGGCYGDPIRTFLPGHMPDARLVDAGPYPDSPDAPDALEIDAVVCTTLATSSATVNAVAESGSAPTPAGGALPDATYVLESVHAYGGAPVVKYKLTFKVLGSGTMYELASRQTSDAVDDVQSGTFAIDSGGAMVTFLRTCPSSGNPASVPYTYNTGDGSFDWFESGGAITQLTHFVPM